ncbi:hypothetical protein LINGRAHAP2_LOCUS14559 [Linum grandiflorum]
MADNLEGLRQVVDEDEGFVFEEQQKITNIEDLDLRVVRSFLTRRPINFNVMRVHMADIWQPGCGIKIEDLGDCLFLFRFFSRHRYQVRGG